MTSVASQKPVPSMLISVEETGKNQPEPGQESIGDAPVFVTFFSKATLTKTDRCVGTLSGSRNELLALHFSRRSLLTATPR